MEITVNISDRLGQQLQQFSDRLPEVLERGMQELLNEQSGDSQEVSDIVGLLARQPTPEQILAIRPSSELQARMSGLLEQSKVGTLARQDEIELERYLALEHLVRLAKTHAYEQLRQSS